jgi:hypothetical protein
MKKGVGSGGPEPDPLVIGMDPDPHQHVMDQQHWLVPLNRQREGYNTVLLYFTIP